MKRVYFDYSATTPLDDEVFDAMKPYFTEKFGNASSIHRFGQEAKFALEESRAVIAKALHAQPGEIIFAGSGTEANNFALKGITWKLRSKGKTHIITSKIEHHSILEVCEFLTGNGFTVSYCDVDEFGMVQVETVRNLITPETGLISIMHANNEIGTINPIAELGQLARERNILFHTDAIQTFGKIPIDVEQMNIDLLSISAHKIYGPKGIGALFLRRGIDIESFIHGGGQERGRRAGTESIPLVVGFGKATEIMKRDVEQEAEKNLFHKNMLRRLIEERCLKNFPEGSVIFNGHPKKALPNILNVSFDSSKIALDGETLLLNMDLCGVAVTSGSACTSGSMEPSHVLLALHRDEKTTKATIRFSFGRLTTEDDIMFAVDALETTLKRVAKL